MDYGIGIPSYIDAWREVQAAEEAGFTHAWFYDSQLIYSDVYATMALAAQNTSRIRLGTLVAIPSNRIAPVTASAIATINKLAPGRVILALGTGYTGRNTMGLPAISVKGLKEYTRQIRGPASAMAWSRRRSRSMASIRVARAPKTRVSTLRSSWRSAGGGSHRFVKRTPQETAAQTTTRQES